MIKIEVFAGDDKILSRTAGGKTYHYQQGYLHKPSLRFPLPFQIPLTKDTRPYPTGCYTLSPESVRINQYQSLELTKFSLELIPLVDTKSAS